MSTSPMTLGQAVWRQRHARVLLAEDDAAMRQLLVLQLRRAGIELVDVGSGDEALNCIADHHDIHGSPFDVVIADIRMPGCSGLDLLGCLRYLDRDLPVILITGFGTEETHHRAERLGAFAVFDKPFDLEALQSAVLRAWSPRP